MSNHRRQLLPILVLLLAILPLATVLRVHALGEDSLWYDEFVSVRLAHQDWGSFWDTRALDPNMALYYALLRAWVVLGDQESTVRALSVVFSVAAILAVYALGTRLFGAKVGLIGALLLAVNAFDIRFAQEARSYSLLALLASLSSLFFVKGVQEPSRGNWVWYTVTSVLAAYSHLFGLLIVPAHWASLAFLPRRRIPWRALLLSTAAIGILLVPLGLAVLATGSEQIDWVRPVTLGGVPRQLSYLTGAGGFEGLPSAGSLLAPGNLSRRLLAAGYFVSVLGALLRPVRAWSTAESSTGSWRVAFLGTWFSVPIALTLAISLLKPVFIIKYLIICVAPLVLLAALGLSRIRPRWILAGAVVVFVGVSAQNVVAYYDYFEKEDWRGVTSYILSEAIPGDAVLFYRAQGAFAYYRGRLNQERSASIRVLRDWIDISPAPDRIWLALRHSSDVGPEVISEIHAALSATYSAVEERRFTGVSLRLYRKAN